MLSERASFRSFGKPASENLASPLPNPVFFFKEKTFSMKKERQASRDRPPPTPKPYFDSCRSYSSRVCQRPKSVSFVEGDTPLSSKYYNEKSDQLYFNQCFDIIRKLGTGSFGEVFMVLSKEDGKYYAIKRSKEKFHGTSDRLRKMEEVKKHEQLPKHQNCVQFYKAWEERDHLYIQLELCEVSLSQYSEENHDIPELTIWNYLVDLLLAVKHLHDHDFIHLDIKPENMFVTKDGVCKLGDFGLVLDLSKSDLKDATEGDSKYLAPELMHGVFTKAADVFSLGITMLELACDLDLPQRDVTWHQLRQKQIPAKFLKNLSPELADVIQSMMEPDHKQRPTIDDVLAMEAVVEVYKKRTLELQMKASTPSQGYQDSYNWNNSFSDEDVFENEKSLSGVSNVSNCSLDNLCKPLDLVINRVGDNVSFHPSEQGNAFQMLDFVPNNSSVLSKSEKRNLTKILSPRMSSSPKLTKHNFNFAARYNLDENGPCLKPQNLLSLFEEHSSDESF